MDIKELQKNWDEFGKIDPLWATFSDPCKKGNKWQIEEYFATGVREIQAVMEYVKSVRTDVLNRKALDFGCGVGRLSQAFTNYFDEVHGVDIAPSMIELAEKYNRYGDKCRYYLNETDDLKLFSNDSFDFIYTNITFLHMEPKYSIAYIKEFLRILSLNGLLIFRLPSQPRIFKDTGMISLKGLLIHIIPKKLLDRVYRKVKYRNQPRMECYWIKKRKIIEFLKKNGAKIIDIKQEQAATIVDCQYCVTKNKPA